MVRTGGRSVALLAGALALTACSSGSGSTASHPQASARAVAGRIVDMSAQNFVFVPSVISGQPGEHLQLRIHNTTGIEHNFTLKTQSLNEDLSPRSTMLVSITVPESGSLRFTCEYHAARGMAGTLQAAGAPAANPATTAPASGGGAGGY